MPQELQLPDGRILVLPDKMTLDQRAALRNKLGSQYADIKTGAGMEQRAQQQAKGTLSSRIQYESDLDDPAYWDDLNRRQLKAVDVAGAGLGLQGMSVPRAIGTVVGSGTGAAGGGYVGEKAGDALFGEQGKQIGKKVGGWGGALAGGYYGSMGGSVPGTKGSILGSLADRIAGRGSSVSADAALADRIAAERNAERLIRTPEEWSASEQIGRASEAPTQAAAPQARLTGMIRSGRGERPQLTNEELDYLRQKGTLPPQ